MIYCIAGFFTRGGEGNMTVRNWNAFRFYTIDSNVLCALSCLPVICYNIKGIKRGQLELPTWALVLKFCGTVAVMVTFLIVILFLGPTQGYRKMFAGANIFMHLLNPLIAVIGLMISENGFEFPKKLLLFGDVSVIVYGTLYLFMIKILKCWPDYYGFDTVLRWWFSYPAMIAFGYFLSLGIWKLYMIISRKLNEE